MWTALSPIQAAVRETTTRWMQTVKIDAESSEHPDGRRSELECPIGPTRIADGAAREQLIEHRNTQATCEVVVTRPSLGHLATFDLRSGPRQRRDRLDEMGDICTGDAVLDQSPSPCGAHQPTPAQAQEVIRDVGLAQPTLRSQLVDRSWLHQQPEQAHPTRFRDDFRKGPRGPPHQLGMMGVAGGRLA